MSLLVQAQTSDDDAEIMECLYLVLKSSSLGLIHESVNVQFPGSYTRKLFCVSSLARCLVELALTLMVF
jgi:meiotically up-regulated gene 157 (Mug157) protein